MGRRAAAAHLRIDARRPASWLALAGGAGAAWWIAADAGGARAAAAIVAGAVVSAAAVGVPPREGPGDAASWALMRAAWAAVGVAGSWLASGADPAAAGPPAVMVAAALAVAATIASATRRGLPPADATGQALACAVAAAVAAQGTAAVAATGPTWAPRLWVAAAVAGWIAMAAGVRLSRGVAGGPPARGPLGGGLPRAAMATSLAGMVIFLFLAPQLSRAYAGLAAAWLLVAAGPRAALGVGPDGVEPARAAARTVGAYAAVLAWPPVVAAILAGSTTAASEPLAIAATIGVGAGVVVAAAAGSLAWCRSRETALAIVLLATLGACGYGARLTPGRGQATVGAAD